MTETKTDYDYDVDVDPAAMSRVISLAEKQLRATERVQQLTEDLAKANEVLREVSEEQLPLAMLDANVRTFTLANGREVSLEDRISASLPSQGAIKKAKGERRDALVARLRAGLDWLRDHRHEGVIKNEITVEVGRGKDNVAGELSHWLDEHDLPYATGETVNTQTLSALVRELLETGIDLPRETLGVYQVTRAKIK